MSQFQKELSIVSRRPRRIIPLRCSRPLCSSQSTGGPHPAARTSRHTEWAQKSQSQDHSHTRSLRTQQRARPASITPTVPNPKAVLSRRSPERSLVKRSTHELPADTFGLIRVLEGRSPQMLLRKEVIQPHLPVRLPCYDLVLITDPTFDGSLHKGWATGFRCYRLS